MTDLPRFHVPREDEPRVYRTKTGRVLTDVDIEALAAEAERGYDASDLARRPGRPLMGSGPAGPVPWDDPDSSPLADVVAATVAAQADALTAVGGFCAPADLTLYDLVDRAPWTHPDPSWWSDVDVGAWLCPRLTAARLALREARRRLVVAYRVLHHGYGWPAAPNDDD